MDAADCRDLSPITRSPVIIGGRRSEVRTTGTARGRVSEAGMGSMLHYQDSDRLCETATLASSRRLAGWCIQWDCERLADISKDSRLL